MHKVVVDRSHAVVSLTASGFMDEAGLREAAADLHRAIRSLGDRAGRHVTLYDLSDLRVASAKILEAFADYFTNPTIGALWASRVALVTASPLFRLQLERVKGIRPICVFEDRRAAMAWLLADQDRLRTISQPIAASG